MISTLANRKTLLATSLGICFLGSVYAAYRIYSWSSAASDAKSKKKASSASSKNSNNNNNKTRSNANTGTSSTTSKALTSSRVAARKLAAAKKKRPTAAAAASVRTAVINGDDHETVVEVEKTMPSEELLELGLNYMHQAIKSWETALDHIESAAYMQSQKLALPNDEHAELVYKLRNLVDMANNISTSTSGTKLVKSSATLQIIQSRLAIKQQLYADALLRNQQVDNKTTATTTNDAASADQTHSANFGESSLTSAAKDNDEAGDNDDDDNESFVSADSDVDWLNEEMLRNIEHFDEKNVLYQMAMSSVQLGRVSYRVSRCELLQCQSEEDFAAKVHVIRLGFDRLLQDTCKRQWLIGEGRELLGGFLRKCDKDYIGFYKAYDELVRFVSVEANWPRIRDELATRDVAHVNFYDMALDFLLMDSFDDLEAPPSAITAVMQNSWLSQSFKETALSTAVWSVLKAKRKLLKYPDGFITRFYSITEYLVPSLVWGFFGTDAAMTRSCNSFKDLFVEYMRRLFDAEHTRYTSLDELAADLEAHTVNYLGQIARSF